jgi:hypothetical protein
MPTSSPPRAPRFQFSLATLLVLITVTAIFLGVVTTVAGSILFAVFSWILLYILPTVVFACAIYGRGDVRAFAIGALIPIVAFMLRGPMAGARSSGLVESVFSTAITSGICGLVAAITRRWLLDNRADSD